jgi:8-oxo-dGTP diphosphatase
MEKMLMSNYVLVNAIPHVSGYNLLVLKNKPAWMLGKFNLIGGKIEENELPQIAALRELKEESGLDGFDLNLMGKMTSDDSDIIYCYNAVVDASIKLKPRTEETEKIGWFNWEEIINDVRLIPNLRLIIPLMNHGVLGWELKVNHHEMDQTTYSIHVEMPGIKNIMFSKSKSVDDWLTFKPKKSWYNKFLSWFF